ERQREDSVGVLRECERLPELYAGKVAAARQRHALRARRAQAEGDVAARRDLRRDETRRLRARLREARGDGEERCGEKQKPARERCGRHRTCPRILLWTWARPTIA